MQDRVFWIDVIPNQPPGSVFQSCLVVRHCEFGYAAVQRNLEGERKVLYVGFGSEKQVQRARKLFRDYIYKKWDGMPGSPPAARPPDENEGVKAPELSVLAWENGCPLWPSTLSTRFEESTPEHAKILAVKKEFDEAFPETSRPVKIKNSGTTPSRAGGFCDYSVDGGKQPLKTTREIDLKVVSDSDFQAEMEGRREGN